jgi:predicted MFS family arabinose efflux permease
VAGALVSWTGGAPAFGVAAVLSTAAVVLLAGLGEPAEARADAGPRVARHALIDLREGAAFVFGHPLLRPVLLTQIVFNTAFFALQAVYVPYAVHRLGLSASGVGATLAAYGIGMVAGALAAPRILRALPFGLVVVTGPLAGLAAAGAWVRRSGRRPWPRVGHQYRGVWSAAGGLLGPEAALVVAGAGFLAQALLIMTSPVPRLERQPEMARPAPGA